MADRYDLLAARPYIDGQGEEKTYFSKIGTVWPMKDRDGFSITFDALPVPSIKDGKVETRAIAMPPKPRDGEQPAQQQQQPSGGGYNRDKGARRIPENAPSFEPGGMDDDIPF